MNKLLLIIAVFLGTLFSSCHTFTLSYGKKYRQMFPVKDRSSFKQLDTNKYWLQIVNFRNGGKSTIVPDDKKEKKIIYLHFGKHLEKHIRSSAYIYFWNPYCTATKSHIRILDSLRETGEQIFILSLRNDYEFIENALKNTGFANLPIHIVGNQQSKILLQRKVDFIKELCSKCYELHKDDLIFTPYVIIANDRTYITFPNSKDNILR